MFFRPRLIFPGWNLSISFFRELTAPNQMVSGGGHRPASAGAIRHVISCAGDVLGHPIMSGVQLDMGVSENKGYLTLGRIMRILLFRVLY